MKLSVIICTYNGGARLGEVLHCLSVQQRIDHGKWELTASAVTRMIGDRIRIAVKLMQISIARLHTTYRASSREL